MDGHSLGRTLALLGNAEKSVLRLQEARQAVTNALEIDPEDEDWRKMVNEIDEAISKLLNAC